MYDHDTCNRHCHEAVLMLEGKRLATWVMMDASVSHISIQ